MSYCVAARLRAKVGAEDRVADGLRANESQSRTEPGVLTWIVYRSTDEPRTFLLYEVYRGRADFEAHRASAHFERYVREVVPLLEVREISTWEELTP